MTASRSVLRRAALKYFVNGRRAQDLHGLTDLAGNVLSAFDTATSRDQVLDELHTTYTTELGRQWRLKRSK